MCEGVAKLHRLSFRETVSREAAYFVRGSFYSFTSGTMFCSDFGGRT